MILTRKSEGFRLKGERQHWDDIVGQPYFEISGQKWISLTAYKQAKGYQPNSRRTNYEEALEMRVCSYYRFLDEDYSIYPVRLYPVYYLDRVYHGDFDYHNRHNNYRMVDDPKCVPLRERERSVSKKASLFERLRRFLKGVRSD